MVAALYLSFLTYVRHLPSVECLTNKCCRLVTLFIYMVAELSALQQVINALTGLNGLPTVIVQCVVTTIYTCEALFERPEFQC
jgi:Na+(H+)/acetate symporter ActP